MYLKLQVLINLARRFALDERESKEGITLVSTCGEHRSTGSTPREDKGHEAVQNMSSTHDSSRSSSTDGLMRTSFSLPSTGSRILPVGQRNLLGSFGQGQAMASIKRYRLYRRVLEQLTGKLRDL